MDAIDELRRDGAYDPQVRALRARIVLLEDEKRDLYAEIRLLKHRLELRQPCKLDRDCVCPHCGGFVRMRRHP